jgi:hypothetical protein
MLSISVIGKPNVLQVGNPTNFQKALPSYVGDVKERLVG